jgi:hypothetical protein
MKPAMLKPVMGLKDCLLFIALLTKKMEWFMFTIEFVNLRIAPLLLLMASWECRQFAANYTKNRTCIIHEFASLISRQLILFWN